MERWRARSVPVHEHFESLEPVLALRCVCMFSGPVSVFSRVTGINRYVDRVRFCRHQGLFWLEPRFFGNVENCFEPMMALRYRATLLWDSV